MTPEEQEAQRTAVGLLLAWADDDEARFDALLDSADDLRQLVYALVGLTSALTGISRNREAASRVLGAIAANLASKP